MLSLYLLCDNFSPIIKNLLTKSSEMKKKKTSSVKKKGKKSQTSARVKPRALERAAILIMVT